MTGLTAEIRSLFRQLSNRPLFVGGIVLTLMLGIGANAALKPD